MNYSPSFYLQILVNEMLGKGRLSVKMDFKILKFRCDPKMPYEELYESAVQIFQERTQIKLSKNC